MKQRTLSTSDGSITTLKDSQVNHRIILHSRPVGAPSAENFHLQEVHVPEPGDGQVLLRTLYLSLDTGLPSSFEPITGLEPQSREKRTDFAPVTINALGDLPQIPSGGEFKVRLKATRAEVLGIEEDGNPAFSVTFAGSKP